MRHDIPVDERAIASLRQYGHMQGGDRILYRDNLWTPNGPLLLSTPLLCWMYSLYKCVQKSIVVGVQAVGVRLAPMNDTIILGEPSPGWVLSNTDSSSHDPYSKSFLPGLLSCIADARGNHRLQCSAF